MAAQASGGHSTVSTRPLRPSDLAAFGRDTSPYRLRGWAAVIGERVIGIGGIAFLTDGTHLAFVDMTDEARRYPVAIHKTGKRFIEQARAWGVRRMVAAADPTNPAADRWLLRLGFEPAATVEGREIFTWTASSSSA